MKAKHLFLPVTLLLTLLIGCSGPQQQPSTGVSTTQLQTQQIIVDTITERIPSDCKMLIGSGERPVSVLILSDGASITIKACTDYCIPALAEEMLPIVLNVLEENNTAYSKISFTYYEMSGESIIKDTMVDWTTKDGETGTFAVTSGTIVKPGYSITDLKQYYKDYAGAVERIRKGDSPAEAEINAAADAEAESIRAFEEKFGDSLDIYQGEWRKLKNKYGRLVIDGNAINFISEMDIGSKHSVTVNTFYFDVDDKGTLIIANQHGQPRYNVSLDENGILSIKNISGSGKDESYEKVSDSKDVPAETKEPAIGMTEQEVYASTWGYPKKKNTTTTASKTREQWVYEDGYIYFEEGRVTSIQKR